MGYQLRPPVYREGEPEGYQLRPLGYREGEPEGYQLRPLVYREGEPEGVVPGGNLRPVLLLVLELLEEIST